MPCRNIAILSAFSLADEGNLSNLLISLLLGNVAIHPYETFFLASTYPLQGAVHHEARGTCCHSPFSATLTACAPSPNHLQGTAGPRDTLAGFWLGLWQGFITPFVFVISLFTSGLNIYEVHNNGSWYNFGYLFGLLCFFGGGHKTGQRR